MALSQIQCLDDNHVNPRTHESKPEFFYCEDQRLALETLLHDGREAFFKYLEARGLRGFLSDPELETLTGAVEPYDPGSELFLSSSGEDEPPLSLHYWPELSDRSIPQMDLGWPDTDAYRGVTRTTVYSQPPLDGQAHVKEIVRKMIAQAQKVIAVVMDVFTDVDIFRDLIDAGFKRKVSVYILLERSTLPHFLSMCQRANMHAGHLKHLRVRCTEGAGFYTRSSTRVRGRLGHRFMFIDGDKAVSGSYGFTWMSSRLDRNLITVVTGQAVDAFDKLFRFLYVTSDSVDLRQVATEPEPEPEALPQPASVVPPSAAIARKLYNPKYALVSFGNPSPSPTPSTGNDPPKETPNPETSKNPEDTKKKRRRRASLEAIQDTSPIHPGLIDLEKACLISYLPTWPEPDPPSDVIGFINIRDSRKPTQVHLQRSEMFETSQAIRFSSPFSMPKETLPEVAKPRQFTAKRVETNKLQPAQDKAKAEKSVVDRAPVITGPGDIKSKAEVAASGPKCVSENKLHSNTLANQDAGHNTPPHLNAQAPPQSNSKALTPNTGTPAHGTQTVTTNSPKPDPTPAPNTKKEADTSSNTQSALAHTLDQNSAQTSHQHQSTDSEQHTQTKTVLPRADSPQNSSEITPNIQTPTANSHMSSSSTSAMCSQSVSSTSLSESNHDSISSSSSLPPLASSSTTLNPPLPSSSESSSLTPPIPKPRTIQLVIKDAVTSDSQKLPEVSIVRRPETSTAPPVVHTEPNVATMVPEKEPEPVPELQNNNGGKTGAQKDAENTGIIGETTQQKQSGTSQETKMGKTGTKVEAQSDVLITDAPKTESVNIQEIIPKNVEPKTLTSIDSKLAPQIDCVATVQPKTKAPERALTGCELSEEPNVNSNNVTQGKTYRARAHVPQRISYCESAPQDVGVLEAVDSTHTPVSAPHNPHISKDGAGDSTRTSAADRLGQQGNPGFTPAQRTNSTSNTVKQNTHFQELIPKARGTTHKPEKPLRLHLPDTHMPDLRTPTPDRESRSLTPLIRSPTPDIFPTRTPTPDSRANTPDPRSYTPDFQTPTADISDGYVSPLSTTSDEYYECSDSPFHEPVFDRAAFRNHGTTEDHVSSPPTNSPNATIITTSPAYISFNTRAATARNTSSSDTQSLPARVPSSSSILEKKVKMEEEKDEAANEENGREDDEKGKKVRVAERRTEGDSPGAERRGNEEATRTADHVKQVLTETVEEKKETQPQVPKRKKVLNQSVAERLVDGGVTTEGLTNDRAELKRLSAGDLKAKKVSAEAERPEKEKAALGPSSVERRNKAQSPRETEGQKILHPPPRPPRGLQQDSRAPSPSRPSRPPRPLSGSQPLGPRPWGSRQPNHTERKVLHGSFQALDNASSPRRPPSRPPLPSEAGAIGPTAWRKQADASHSQQSFLSRQPPAAQGRAKTGQSQNQHPYPKPQASFLHTHTNTQLGPHSQNRTVSAQETQREEEGRSPFGFTFSRLYSLKGLKDKINKGPAQSKRSSTSSPVQRRKSTS